MYIFADFSGLTCPCSTTHFIIFYFLCQFSDRERFCEVRDFVQPHRVSQLSFNSVSQHINHVLSLSSPLDVEFLLLLPVSVKGCQRSITRWDVILWQPSLNAYHIESICLISCFANIIMITLFLIADYIINYLTALI